MSRLQANHLIHEHSPYLQQHVYNPVNWYPWGQEALEKALDENKPILLSIGYAACHWCHVMAHESFEDQETAALMNKLFINIKVDKEERPDLDKIYQTSHSILSQQQGGWPLNIFLTPDLTPFFSGTYFPREAHPQLPAFKKILQAISEFYQRQPEDITKQNNELKKILHQQNPNTAEVVLNSQPVQLALENLQQNYDENYGGFGSSPKFPQASKLEFLLKNQSPLALSTLIHMANRGIYDQLAGGFYRYCVDQRWGIPHFEKMLYDNGQLLTLYSLAAKQDTNPILNNVIRKTAEWVIAELQARQGGYYSSFDADSDGQEGAFYRWKKSEIKTLLTADEYAFTSVYFGLDKAPNFEGYWHLYVAKSLQATSDSLTISLEKAQELLSSATEKLLRFRNQRIPPARDEKILTAWNSLMIKGMFLAGVQLQEEHFIISAQKAMGFIQQKLWHNEHLFASHKDGQSYLSAYLDDYAFLLDALMTSLQVVWNSAHLLFAKKIADAILENFSDETAGGFFFTARNHEELLYRPKTMMDEAIPAGNAIAVRSLLLLGHLLGDLRYLTAAEKTLQAAWPTLIQYPAEHCSLLLGLQDYLEPPQIIIIRGKHDELKTWQNESRSLNNYVFAIPNDTANLPESLSWKKSQEGCCAYICHGTQCKDVVKGLAELKTKIY